MASEKMSGCVVCSSFLSPHARGCDGGWLRASEPASKRGGHLKCDGRCVMCGGGLRGVVLQEGPRRCGSRLGACPSVLCLYHGRRGQRRLSQLTGAGGSVCLRSMLAVHRLACVFGSVLGLDGMKGPPTFLFFFWHSTAWREGQGSIDAGRWVQ